MSERVRGEITRYIDNRGFGFIRTDGDLKEHFFHHSDCAPRPEIGMRVCFEIGFDKTDRTKCIKIESERQENENQN